MSALKDLLNNTLKNAILDVRINHEAVQSHAKENGANACLHQSHIQIAC